MAFTVTYVSVVNLGSRRMVVGTFTSAEGDTTLTLTKTAGHGLNGFDKVDISLDPGVLASQPPKITTSGTTITAIWDDTQGISGRFELIGS